ncbi:hypothetical protein F4815DRAFT_481554 [Daldinia loculata]|nr:hypothetical protein F4815DRAFT_481554 [Daldinia loculata]
MYRWNNSLLSLVKQCTLALYQARDLSTQASEYHSTHQIPIDFSPIPQFLFGWTLALLAFAFYMFWDDALYIFVRFVYFYLTVAGACLLITIHPALFMCVFLYICCMRY